MTTTSTVPQATRFTPGCRGFVVQRISDTLVTYWSGPSRMCVGSGPLDYSAAVFTTRGEATRAASTVWPRRLFRVVTAKEATAESIARHEDTITRLSTSAYDDRRAWADGIIEACHKTNAYLRGES